VKNRKKIKIVNTNYVQLNVNLTHQNELTHLANVFYSPKHGNMTDGKRTSVQAVSLLIGHRENDSQTQST
jgi:hypothetical protein